MAEAIVPAGPYYGFTYDQLVAARTALVARRQQVSSLIGSSINGDSFQHEGSQTGLRTLDQQAADLQDAFYVIGFAGAVVRPAFSSRIRFNDC